MIHFVFVVIFLTSKCFTYADDLVRLIAGFSSRCPQSDNNTFPSADRYATRADDRSNISKNKNCKQNNFECSYIVPGIIRETCIQIITNKPRFALVIPPDAIKLSIHNVNPLLFSIDGYFYARNKNKNCPLSIFLGYERGP